MAKTQPTSIQILEDPILTENVEALIYDLAVKSGMFVPINKYSLRYKKYMVLKGPDDRWHVFLMPGKRHIESFFLKVSALTACKLHEKHRSKSMQDLVRDDRDFQKNYLDSIYYKNTYKRSTDRVKRNTAEWRWEIAYDTARKIKVRLDRSFQSLTA